MSNNIFGGGFTGFGNTANNNNTANQQQQQQPSGSAPTQPSNLFGAAPGTGAGSLFGGAATPTTSTQAPKPFGSFGFGAASTTTAPGGGLFGNTNSTTPNAGAASGGAAPATSLFSKPNLFGNAGPTASTPATGGGLFGGGAASSTTPAGGSGFGGGGLFGGAKQPTTTGTTTAAPATGGLFGAQPKPAETPAATTATAPATSLFGNLSNTGAGGSTLFGNPATTTGAASTTAPAPPSLPPLFGNKDAAQSTAAPGSTAPATGGLGLFGAAKDKDAGAAQAAPSLFGQKPPAATTTATPGLGLFGNVASATAKDTKDAAKLSLFGNAVPATTTTPAPGAADAPKTATPAPGGGLFGNVLGNAQPKPAATPTTATAGAGANAQAPATAAPPLLPPSVLKGKSLEDIVDQWSADLEVQAVEFKRLAGEVQEWDRVLIDNGNQIAVLHTAVMEAERVQADVEKSLEHIEDQQKQLSDALDGYEQATAGILESQGMRGMDVGPADAERGKNYALATSLNTQLDSLARSLSSMIDEVNNVTAPSSSHRTLKPADNTTSLAASQQAASKVDDDADPMTQIQNILNAHLDSLSWINGTVRELDGKVGDLERKFGAALPPALEEKRAPPPLARNGGSRGLMQQSTILESNSGGSRYGYGLRR